MQSERQPVISGRLLLETAILRFRTAFAPPFATLCYNNLTMPASPRFNNRALWALRMRPQTSGDDRFAAPCNPHGHHAGPSNEIFSVYSDAFVLSLLQWFPAVAPGNNTMEQRQMVHEISQFQSGLMSVDELSDTLFSADEKKALDGYPEINDFPSQSFPADPVFTGDAGAKFNKYQIYNYERSLLQASAQQACQKFQDAASSASASALREATEASALGAATASLEAYKTAFGSMYSLPSEASAPNKAAKEVFVITASLIRLLSASECGIGALGNDDPVQLDDSARSANLHLANEAASQVLDKLAVMAGKACGVGLKPEVKRFVNFDLPTSAVKDAVLTLRPPSAAEPNGVSASLDTMFQEIFVKAKEKSALHANKAVVKKPAGAASGAARGAYDGRNRSRSRSRSPSARDAGRDDRRDAGRFDHRDDRRGDNDDRRGQPAGRGRGQAGGRGRGRGAAGAHRS